MKAAPYNDLFIYYLEGYLHQKTYPFSGTFIGNWEEDGFSFLFFSTNADDELEILLHVEPHLKLLDTYEMSYDQWQGGQIKPFRVGRFLIAPPWEEIKLNKADIHIVLDPGVVFGNGMHATTQDCLESITLACYKEHIETAIDIGTGTGVLALAVSKLGCRKVLAVDSNYLAALTAHNNVLLNQFDNQVVVVQGRAEDSIAYSSDLLIANIHYEVMLNLIHSQYFMDHKWFVLSGLLRSEAKDISDQLTKYPIKLLNVWNSNGVWYTFLGKRC